MEQIINDILKSNIKEELINNALKLDESLIILGNNTINYYISYKLQKEFSIIENDKINQYYSISVINQLKNKLLSNDNYKQIINKLHLNELQEVDKLADLLKALIGAYVITYDINKTADLIDEIFNLDEAILLNLDLDVNYANLVFEWSKKKNNTNPLYKIEKIDDVYLSTITLNGIDNEFKEHHSNRLISLELAFKSAFKYLEENDLLLKMSDVVGFADSERCVSQLQELFVKGYINEPVYKISLKGNNQGVDIWKCRILIDGYKETFTAEDTTKNKAKRLAAFQMLQYIMGK